MGQLALNLHVINELVGTDHRTLLDEIGVETIEKAIKLTSFYTDQIKLIHANEFHTMESGKRPRTIAMAVCVRGRAVCSCIVYKLVYRSTDD
jgi:enamine deaminase RidA (YjgF/YER057c/UK114 family)